LFVHSEAPAELTIQMSVHFALLVDWPKAITSSFAGLATCRLSQSELAGTSEQVFHFSKLFYQLKI